MAEEHERLSRSNVFSIMDKFYAKMGYAAWELDRVPSYVTTNAFLADTYASTIAAFCNDLLLQYVKQPVKEHADFHVDVLDIGAGSGALSIGVYRALRRRADTGPLVAAGRIRIILLDYSVSVIKGLMYKYELMCLARKGRLDFAIFNCHVGEQLQLQVSKETLTSKTAPNRHGVLICQYLFDSLRSDAFMFAGGSVYEGLVRSVAASEERLEEDGADRLHLEWKWSEVEDGSDSCSDYPDPTDSSVPSLSEYYRPCRSAPQACAGAYPQKQQEECGAAAGATFGSTVSLAKSDADLFNGLLRYYQRLFSEMHGVEEDSEDEGRDEASACYADGSLLAGQDSKHGGIGASDESRYGCDGEAAAGRGQRLGRADCGSTSAQTDGEADPGSGSEVDLVSVQSARLLLPIGSIRLIRSLRALFPGGMLLLCTDKGHADPACFAGQPDPEAARHGSVSFMVNFHALQLAVSSMEGASWHSNSEHSSTKLFAAAFRQVATESSQPTSSSADPEGGTGTPESESESDSGEDDHDGSIASDSDSDDGLGCMDLSPGLDLDLGVAQGRGFMDQGRRRIASTIRAFEEGLYAQRKRYRGMWPQACTSIEGMCRAGGADTYMQLTNRLVPGGWYDQESDYDDKANDDKYKAAVASHASTREGGCAGKPEYLGSSTEAQVTASAGAGAASPRGIGSATGAHQDQLDDPSLRQMLPQCSAPIGLPDACAILRYSRFDPDVLAKLRPVIEEQAASASELERRDMSWCAREVIRARFDRGVHYDLEYELAVVLDACGERGSALQLLRKSWARGQRLAEAGSYAPRSGLMHVARRAAIAARGLGLELEAKRWDRLANPVAHRNGQGAPAGQEAAAEGTPLALPKQTGQQRVGGMHHKFGKIVLDIDEL